MKIIIEPSKAHPDFLSVQDTMEQVLDYFRLVTISDDLQKSQDIVWRLVSVTMASPFEVTAEATSFNPIINVEEVAKKQKGMLAYGMESILKKGITPPEWASREAKDIVNRILKRNQNGIGKTSIITDWHKKAVPIEITPQLAESAITEILKEPSLLFSDDLTHKEWGSVDGYLVGVGSYYREPAIQIADRLTGELVMCRVPEETRDLISTNMKLNDVWKHRRIIVSGLVQYEKTGKISKIYNAQIEVIDTRKVSLEEIHDNEFTGDMTPAEYLNHIHEGNLGR